MAEETLHTAARRVVRDMNIDLNKGGIVTVQTQRSLETLDRMVLKESERLQQIEQDHLRNAVAALDGA